MQYVLITPSKVVVYTSWAKAHAVIARYARRFPETVVPNESPWAVELLAKGQMMPKINGWQFVGVYTRTPVRVK